MQIGIGELLRETRIRQRLDISQVELATKIRAKYLRALEHEEWSLLPASTYTKTFLRTYADYLGLDGKAIVTSYKRQFETTKPVIDSISPKRQLTTQEPSRARRLLPAIVGVSVLVVLAVLYALGNGPGNKNDDQPSSQADMSAIPKSQVSVADRTKASVLKPKSLHIKSTAKSKTYICLVDGNGRRLVPGKQLASSQSLGPFKAKRFRIAISSNKVELHWHGKRIDVPKRNGNIGLDLTAGKAPVELTPEQQPRCT